MNTYTATFAGRELGAIGIFQSFSVEVKAKDVEAAKLKLYDTHEHITRCKIVLKDELEYIIHTCDELLG